MTVLRHPFYTLDARIALLTSMGPYEIPRTEKTAPKKPSTELSGPSMGQK